MHRPVLLAERDIRSSIQHRPRDERQPAAR
jgi:hypothetical protein